MGIVKRAYAHDYLSRLADTTSVAKLTSLEELFSTMMSTELISPEVIERLWTVYGRNQHYDSVQSDV